VAALAVDHNFIPERLEKPAAFLSVVAWRLIRGRCYPDEALAYRDRWTNQWAKQAREWINQEIIVPYLPDEPWLERVVLQGPCEDALEQGGPVPVLSADEASRSAAKRKIARRPVSTGRISPPVDTPPPFVGGKEARLRR
jgi:hypothetical protein